MLPTTTTLRTLRTLKGRASLCLRARALSTRELASVREQMLDKFLRVDQAGEYGADRIYAGQYSVLGANVSTKEQRRTADLIKHMWDQEKEHLAAFNGLITQYKVRPTILLPIWHIAGFALGAGGALLGGSQGAMAVTVAVEATITEHYNDQIRTLLDHDPEGHAELIKILTKFRDEEQEHHDTGLEEEAEKWVLYEPATAVVKAGCKLAIWLSERI